MAMASDSMRRLQSPLVEPRPTPPPSESIAAAIRRLRAIGAIEDDGSWLRIFQLVRIAKKEVNRKDIRDMVREVAEKNLRWSIGHVDLVELRKQHRRPG